MREKLRQLAYKFADYVQPWLIPRLGELKVPDGGPSVFICQSMRRSAGLAVGCNYGAGIFSMLGMDAAKRAERTWKPWEFLLMEVISFTYHEIEEQRKRGLVIDAEYVDQLIRILQKWYVTTGLKKSPVEVRQMVENYLAEHSVPNPQPYFSEPTVYLPLLDELRLMDKELQERASNEIEKYGLGEVGLRIEDELDGSRYSFCTPLNCRTFASTGGDGVHFSFLIQNDRIDDLSPVAMTQPANCGECTILGEHLYDFLCLGMWTGWFVLEYIPQNLESCICAERPSISGDPGTRDYEREKATRAMLDFVIDRLGLKPWASAVHYDELQYKYAHLLQRPPD